MPGLEAALALTRAMFPVAHGSASVKESLTLGDTGGRNAIGSVLHLEPDPKGKSHITLQSMGAGWRRLVPADPQVQALSRHARLQATERERPPDLSESTTSISTACRTSVCPRLPARCWDSVLSLGNLPSPWLA